MMKSALRLSACLNVALLATVIWLRAHRQKDIPPTTTDIGPITASAPATQKETIPFRWAQLESTNYLTYINNLRGIGCPEPTIRDLVVTDVDHLYAGRAKNLRQSVSGPALQNELQQLAAERDSVIAYLLGTNLVPVAAIASDSPSNEPGIAMPLVWQNIDPAKLDLEPAQLAAVAELRQNFLERIGGTSADANSPEYLEHWQKAQPAMDEALAGQIGRKAYLEYESLGSGLGGRVGF